MSMSEELRKKVPKGITIPENSHNFCPQPIRECKADEFWNMFHTYGVGQFQTFHQVKDLPGKEGTPTGMRSVNIHIFWYDAKAFAISVDWDYKNRASGTEYIPTFYRIGCDHKYVSTYTPRNARDGWREETCTLCNHVNKYDCGD
jgi:hypothetical protein